MTKTTELPQAERQLLEARGKAVQLHLIRCTIGFRRSGREYPFGSGTIVALDDRLFVATASHVMDEVDADCELILPLQAQSGRGFAVRVGDVATHSARTNWERGEPDVALLEVTGDLAKQFPDLNAVPRGRLCLRPGEGARVIVAGFPESISIRRTQSSVNFIETQRVRCLPDVHVRDTDRGRDPDADIHLRWAEFVPRDATFARAPRIEPAFDPHGISGGGAWAVEWPKAPEEVWSPETHCSLIGIVWFWDDEKCIRVARASEWLALARGYLSRPSVNTA